MKIKPTAESSLRVGMTWCGVGKVFVQTTEEDGRSYGWGLAGQPKIMKMEPTADPPLRVGMTLKGGGISLL